MIKHEQVFYFHPPCSWLWWERRRTTPATEDATTPTARMGNPNGYRPTDLSCMLVYPEGKIVTPTIAAARPKLFRSRILLPNICFAKGDILNAECCFHPRSPKTFVLKGIDVNSGNHLAAKLFEVNPPYPPYVNDR